MIGKLFLIQDSNGQLVGQGRVDAQVGPQHYACTLAGKVPVARVIPIEGFQNFLLFDDEKHLSAWVAENVDQGEAPTAPAPGPEEGFDNDPLPELDEEALDIRPAEHIAQAQAEVTRPAR